MKPTRTKKNWRPPTDKPVQRIVWVGFTSGKPDLDLRCLTFDGYQRVYGSRALARKHYQDVRKMELRELDAGARFIVRRKARNAGRTE